LIALLLCVYGTRDVLAERPAEQSLSDFPREARVCGPLALLLYLTLSGTPVSNEVIDRIPCPFGGVSLLELGRIANDNGCPSEIRRFESSEFCQVPTPAIVQAKSGTTLTHYCVVYSADRTGLYVMDGFSPEIQRIKPSSVADVLTGYALIRKTRSASSSTQLFAILLTVGNLLFLRKLAMHGTRREPDHVESVSVPAKDGL
jgi:ABC-type bacteriocin/lantibiotic exporter with double-glycine peptidase domain